MNIKKILLLIIVLVTNLIIAQPGADIVSVRLLKNNFKVAPGTDLKLTLSASVKESWHINSHQPNDEYLIPSQISSGNKSFPLSNIIFPVPEERTLSFSDKPVSVFENDFKVELTIKIDKATANGKYKIPIEFNYQACNDQTCLPPTSTSAIAEIEIIGGVEKADTPVETKIDESKSTSTQGSPLIEYKTESPQNDQSKNTVNENDDSLSKKMDEQGLLLSLIIVFLGGLALNLTPCVYPLIPITIGYFGGQTEGRTSKLFLLGLYYVLGMALTYSVVGVITSLSGAMFGTLLQQPVVIIFICLIFIALALSMFGVYEFKLPDSWMMKAGGARSGGFGAFFMGLTMGIVAAPCIGPFVISLVTVVATKGDPFYGFIMFFVLALGLGFPYLLLALFSGKIKSLPKAGMWMDAIKHIFGFVMIAMALYYIGPLIPKNINYYLLPVFGILVAIYLLFFDKTANVNKGFKTFKTIFSILIIAVAVYALWPVKEKSLPWQEFSENEFALAKSNHEKIILDFYADWCIPCKELDAQTFSNDKVIAEGKDFTAFKADLTQTASETTEKLRKQFNVIGVPTVLIINAKGEEVERLTGFVNADEFLKILKKAN